MRSFWRFLFWSALVIGVVIGLARLVAVRWWRVPAQDPWLEASIAPTLRGGDLILLWRLTAPHTGDLVLCPEPKHPERVVLGRIAAVAGEQLEIDGDELKVNRRRATTESDCFEDTFTVVDPQTKVPLEQHCDMEELGARLHQRGSRNRAPDPKTTVTVPNNQVFLVSDNRQLSYDSRDYGPVDRATCTETVFFRLVGSAGFKDTKNRLTFIR
jgi:signal peptidase I